MADDQKYDGVRTVHDLGIGVSFLPGSPIGDLDATEQYEREVTTVTRGTWQDTSALKGAQ